MATQRLPRSSQGVGGWVLRGAGLLGGLHPSQSSHTCVIAAEAQCTTLTSKMNPFRRENKPAENRYLLNYKGPVI